MSDKPMSKSRRDALKMMMGGLAAVPVLNLVGMAAAQAEDMPHLDEADPMAVALGYKADAAASERTAADQACANCKFQVPPGEGDWLACQLFPSNMVSAGGWCKSWTAKDA